MKLFDRITSYVAIVCALILCFMLVSSAGSFVPDNSTTQKYVPYVPLESIEINTFDLSGSSVIYTLNLSDAFRSINVPDSQSGTESEVLLPLGTTDSNVSPQYVSVQLSTSISSSSTLLVTYTINYNQLPGSGTSDGTEFNITTGEFTYNSSYNTNHYVPSFRFVGMDSSQSSLTETHIDSFMYYKPSNGAATMDITSYSSDYEISGDNPLYDMFGLYEAYNSFLGQNSQNNNIVGSNSIHVKQASFECSNEFGFSAFSITVPYVTEDFADSFYTNWINSFDLGSNTTVTRTIIHTSIVTELVEGTTNYPDFTGFLTTAVKGFMDFGFWGISISGILMAIVGFKLVRVIINFFSGG